jgi:hypothetical protein
MDQGPRRSADHRLGPIIGADRRKQDEGSSNHRKNFLSSERGTKTFVHCLIVRP